MSVFDVATTAGKPARQRMERRHTPGGILETARARAERRIRTGRGGGGYQRTIKERGELQLEW
jgi:hypothetical protein